MAASAMGDSRARALVVVLLFWLVVWLTWRRDDPAYSTRTALRAGLLLSPVAHPWYLAWPCAPANSSSYRPLGPSAPWLLLSLTCVLSYGVLAPPQEGGDFHLPLAWRCVEYGLPAALALALAWRERRREDERPKPRHDHGRLSGRR